MRITVLTLFFSIALSAICAANAADVQPVESEQAAKWESKQFNITFSGNAVKRNDLNKVFHGEALYTALANEKGNVAFSCLAEKLTLNIGLEPVDFEAYFREFPRSRRGRIKLPYLYIAGEKINSGQWVYATNLQIYMPKKKHIVRKIYNAAIRGDLVTLSTNNREHIPLILPKPNSAFADFGAGCGIGRKAS